MAGRQDFTEDEWVALAHAQLAAGYLVAGHAEQSRRDFVQEMYAVFEELRDRSVTADSELVREVAGAHAGGETIDEWHAESEEELLSSMSRAIALVAERAPGDVPAFREHLVSVAERAAKATRHGGFLGIGGTRVTAEEQELVDRVRQAVGAS
ncbi:MAG TPA: hypothetical protein VK894_12370 [Jiangellales bacterium]|nr:hypothetical protein [Jiangellales bacterium]